MPKNIVNIDNALPTISGRDGIASTVLYPAPAPVLFKPSPNDASDILIIFSLKKILLNIITPTVKYNILFIKYTTPLS